MQSFQGINYAHPTPLLRSLKTKFCKDNFLLLVKTGVHKVDAKHEKGQITVEGTFEVKKIHERLEKWSRKKVEILSQDKKILEKKDAKKVRVTST